MIQYAWRLSKWNNPYVVLRDTETHKTATVMYFSVENHQYPRAQWNVFVGNERGGKQMRSVWHTIEEAFKEARRSLR